MILDPKYEAFANIALLISFLITFFLIRKYYIVLKRNIHKFFKNLIKKIIFIIKEGIKGINEDKKISKNNNYKQNSLNRKNNLNIFSIDLDSIDFKKEINFLKKNINDLSKEDFYTKLYLALAKKGKDIGVFDYRLFIYKYNISEIPKNRNHLFDKIYINIFNIDENKEERKKLLEQVEKIWE